MICIEYIMHKKLNELKKLICLIEERQNKAPEGSLRVVRDRKHYSYYHYLREQRVRYPLGKYISKKDSSMIQSLAQKEYDRKVLEWAKVCLKHLERLLAVYQDNACEAIYNEMKIGKREWIIPYEMPLKAFVDRWISTPYERKEISSAANCFITERNEVVRSKTEKILADKFSKMGIPYKYECPLYLKGFGTVYPDFTLLNTHTRKEYYWEHLGMMDNPDYAQKAIRKIYAYERCGIFPGKQLILSYEVKNELDWEAVEMLIQNYLIS